MTKEEKREYMREWRKKNREHVNSYLREYRQKNRDVYLAQKRVLGKAYYVANREKIAERKRAYRAKKKAASPGVGARKDGKPNIDSASVAQKG